MKAIGNFEFPETPEEAETWEKTFRRRALHSRILVVACTRIEGMWSAYIAPVAGENHDLEWEGVWRNGNKLGQEVAQALFPQFEGVPYAR